MRKIALTTAAALAIIGSPATAMQVNNTVPTETQERRAENRSEKPWDLLGLLGLIGLYGLRRKHPSESYHPARDT